MNHPITPPPELVEQWYEDGPGDQRELVEYLATQAARWGADQELEACVNYVDNAVSGNKARALRAARRSKPPSLKEEALAKLVAMERLWEASGNEPSDLVRRALERLDD